jgi:co-chaperonin GroES (HSP10)
MPDLKLDFDSNIVVIGGASFEAENDRLIVLQDEYRSGYECPKCLDKDIRSMQGREVSVIDCENCGGKGNYQKGNLTVKCSVCEAKGFVPCPECQGKGGTIIMAETAKRLPTTGTIVSLGPDIADKRKRGDKVIYPSFSGHAFDLKAYDVHGKVVDAVIVILRDQEIIARMYGTLEQNQVKSSKALHTAA